MKIPTTRCIAIVAVAVELCARATFVNAQTVAPAPTSTGTGAAKVPDGPSATIALASGQSVNARSKSGIFQLVSLKKSELIDVAIQYSSTLSGRQIVLTSLDGAEIVGGKAVTIGSDGFIRFKFKAGKEAGIYQVSLRDGAQEIGLQFWVLDDDPSRNPPTINQGGN